MLTPVSPSASTGARRAPSTCSASRLLFVDRYLAPEVLNRTIDENNFEAFKANDMYAYGLVLWELLRCTRSVNGAHSAHSHVILFSSYLLSSRFFSFLPLFGKAQVGLMARGVLDANVAFRAPPVQPRGHW